MRPRGPSPRAARVARPGPRAVAAGPGVGPQARRDFMSKAAPEARILRVEHAPAARTGREDLLTIWGYEAVAASDGQEALQRSAAWKPDLVIADLVMRGLDGMGLL